MVVPEPQYILQPLEVFPNMHTWVLLQIQKDETLGIGVKGTKTCVREPGFKAILSHILIELLKLRVLVFSLIK